MNLSIATFIIQIVSFLLLVGFLTKLFYKPLLDLLDKRSQSVSSMLDEAKKRQEEACANLKVSRDRVNAVKEEILTLKDEAERQAESERRNLLEEAKKEAKHIVIRSSEEIARQAREAKEEIKKEIGELSVTIAEKIIKKEINSRDQEGLVREFISGLKEKRNE